MDKEEKKESVLKNILWKFLERACAQIVTFSVSIILARLLTPNDYGAIALVTVFVTISDVFITSGIPNALVQKQNPDEIDFSSVFWFNVLACGGIYCLIFVLAPFVGKFYSNDLLVPILRVYAIRIIISGYNSVQHAYVSKKMIFRKFFFSTIIGTILSGVIGIIMAYNGMGVWALVFQSLSNAVVDTMVLTFTIRWKPRFAFSIIRIKELFNYGWKILFEGLSNSLVEQISNLFIGKAYTSSELAFYNRGQQIPGLVNTNLNVAVSSVMFAEMSNRQNDVDEVKSLIRRSTKSLCYLAMPTLIGLAIVSNELVPILLTNKWNGAVVYIRFFCIIYIINTVIIPRNEALKAIGKSDVFMNEHFIARCLFVITLLSIYKDGVKYIVYANIIFSLSIMLITSYTSHKYNRYSLIEQIQDIYKPLLATLVMTILLISIKGLFSGVELLIVQCILGIIAYFIMSIVLRIDEFYKIINILKKRLGELVK